MRNRTPDSSHRWYDELQSENTQALLDRLEAEMDKEEIEDTDLIDAILKLLDERVPVPVPQESPEESLRKFRAQYAPILDADNEEREPRPMGHRILRAAMVACLCVALLLVGAQACGINLIEQFLEWREETFVLRGSNRGGQMTLEEAPDGEYVSMAAAVAAYGITDPIVPTWIPEGFEVQYVRAKESEDAINLTARYTADEDQKIIIKVFFYRSEGEYGVHSEHSDPVGKKYETDGTTYLLSNNNTQCQASWVVGRCTCSINGDLTESEIIHMIDSIFQ